MPTLTLDHTRSLTIPAEVLDTLGLQPGDTVSVETNGTGLVLRKVNPPAVPSLQQTIARKNLTVGMQFIKGIGPKLAELLAKREIRTVEDALFCLPHRYEDRRSLVPIRQLKPGVSQVFQGTVMSANGATTKGGRTVFEVLVQDESGSMLLKWFHANPLWMQRTWKVGRRGVFTGEVTSFRLSAGGASPRCGVAGGRGRRAGGDGGRPGQLRPDRAGLSPDRRSASKGYAQGDAPGGGRIPP